MSNLKRNSFGLGSFCFSFILLFCTTGVFAQQTVNMGLWSAETSVDFDESTEHIGITVTGFAFIDIPERVGDTDGGHVDYAKISITRTHNGVTTSVLHYADCNAQTDIAGHRRLRVTISCFKTIANLPGVYEVRSDSGYSYTTYPEDPMLRMDPANHVNHALSTQTSYFTFTSSGYQPTMPPMPNPGTPPMPPPSPAP